MEFKMKNIINVSSFTFKKQVIEETINLLGEKKNYVRNDIAFYAMIAFLDNMMEENMLIEALGDDKELINKLYNTIEPLFEQHVMNIELNYEVFKDIVEQVEEYMDRESINRHTAAGVLYALGDSIGNLTQEDIMKVIELIEQNIMNKFNKKVVPMAKQAPAKTAEEIEIDNKKIQDLINEFKTNITA